MARFFVNQLLKYTKSLHLMLLEVTMELHSTAKWQHPVGIRGFPRLLSPPLLGNSHPSKAEDRKILRLFTFHHLRRFPSNSDRYTSPSGIVR